MEGTPLRHGYSEVERDHRTMLLSRSFDSMREFNRMANWLCAGQIAATLYIVDKCRPLVASVPSGTACFLAAGSCALVSSLSMWTSAAAHERALQELDGGDTPKRNLFAHGVRVANLLTGVLLVMSLVSLVVFLKANLPVILAGEEK